MKKEMKRLLPVCLCVFAVYLCIHYWGTVEGFLLKLAGAAVSLLIGFVLAYFANILMSFYERHYFPRSQRKFPNKSRRPVCLVGAVLTAAAILAFVLGTVVPELIACVQTLVAKVPDGLKILQKYAEEAEWIPDDWLDRVAALDWQKIITEGAKLLASGVSDVFSLVVSAVSSVVSWVIGLIFSLYLLAGRDRIYNQCRRVARSYVPEKPRKKISRVIATFDDCFHRYIVGQCIEAVILGTLCTIGMTIFRFPYAGMIGALVGVTALIPIAGAYIGAIVGAIMILTESPIKALLFIVFIIILQQIEGNLIYPRVVGSAIRLPSIWVLAGVTVGGGLGGIPGMMVGVPIVASLYRLLGDDVSRREAARAAEIDESAKPEEAAEPTAPEESGEA